MSSPRTPGSQSPIFVVTSLLLVKYIFSEPIRDITITNYGKYKLEINFGVTSPPQNSFHATRTSYKRENCIMLTRALESRFTILPRKKTTCEWTAYRISYSIGTQFVSENCTYIAYILSLGQHQAVSLLEMYINSK